MTFIGVIMFKLFFILSFFLSFSQVSLATKCDRDDVFYDEVDWAREVIEDINGICKGDDTYYCVNRVRACEAIAQEILAEVERERQKKEYNIYLAETTEEEREEDRKRKMAEKKAQDLAEQLERLRERNPELAEELEKLREVNPELAEELEKSLW